MVVSCVYMYTYGLGRIWRKESHSMGMLLGFCVERMFCDLGVGLDTI